MNDKISADPRISVSYRLPSDLVVRVKIAAIRAGVRPYQWLEDILTRALEADESAVSSGPTTS